MTFFISSIYLLDIFVVAFRTKYINVSFTMPHNSHIIMAVKHSKIRKMFINIHLSIEPKAANQIKYNLLLFYIRCLVLYSLLVFHIMRTRQRGARVKVYKPASACNTLNGQNVSIWIHKNLFDIRCVLIHKNTRKTNKNGNYKKLKRNKLNEK